jgi:hypothetical protein
VTPTGSSSAWIGVDGATNSDLFQTGTETDCSSGTQQDFGWVEELPYAAQATSLVISPGNVMSADIHQTSAGHWNFTLLDVSTGDYVSYGSPIAYSGPQDSADWIEEDPSTLSMTLYPYNDFVSVTFSAVTVNGSAPSLLIHNNGIEMVHNNSVVALPSAFASDSFSVSYE